MHSFDSTFRELLMKRLAELYDKKSTDFITGRWVGSARNASMMGVKAAEHIAYLRALSDVERICRELEEELNRS